MAYSIEKTGKTVDEAISSAIEEMGVTEDDVEIEILEEEIKSILGKTKREARVIVTLIETSGEIAATFLQELIEKIDDTAQIEISEEEEKIYLNISTEDGGILIGRRGETLDALQFLTSLAVSNELGYHRRVIVDVGDYREKREEVLVRLANNLADKAEKYDKEIVLEAMNPYERRIIHSTLQENEKVETYSIGLEPNRKVVIKLI